MEMDKSHSMVSSSNEKAGIVYDALGLEGARAKLLLKLTGNAWANRSDNETLTFTFFIMGRMRASLA